MSNPPRFTQRTTGHVRSDDIGPCRWRSCGRPGNRLFKREIEDRLGVEWQSEPDVFYCAVHTPLVVQHAVQTFEAHAAFLGSDVFA